MTKYGRRAGLVRIGQEKTMPESDHEPQIIDSGPVILHATTTAPQQDQEEDDGGDRSNAGE